MKPVLNSSDINKTPEPLLKGLRSFANVRDCYRNLLEARMLLWGNLKRRRHATQDLFSWCSGL